MTTEINDQYGEAGALEALAKQNPQLAAEAAAILTSIADSFDSILRRPDIHHTIAGFIEGNVLFVIDRQELRVVRSDLLQPVESASSTGQYL